MKNDIPQSYHEHKLIILLFLSSVQGGKLQVNWVPVKKFAPPGKGPLVILMKIGPKRVEKYFIFSTLLAGTKIMS